MAPRILRIPEVMKQTGLSKATIYRFIKQGRFPRSVKLGKWSVGWKSDDVKRWIENCEQN